MKKRDQFFWGLRPPPGRRPGGIKKEPKSGLFLFDLITLLQTYLTTFKHNNIQNTNTKYNKNS